MGTAVFPSFLIGQSNAYVYFVVSYCSGRLTKCAFQGLRDFHIFFNIFIIVVHICHVLLLLLTVSM